MRHLLLMSLIVGGPLFKCTGARAETKPIVYKQTCSFIRKQLIDVAQRDPDSYDMYNLADQGVFKYMCGDGPTDETLKLCGEAAHLKCGAL